MVSFPLDIQPPNQPDANTVTAATATTEDFEEQKEKLSNVAYPITSKLYSSGSAEGEEDEPSAHDEL